MTETRIDAYVCSDFQARTQEIVARVSERLEQYDDSTIRRVCKEAADLQSRNEGMPAEYAYVLSFTGNITEGRG